MTDYSNSFQEQVAKYAQQEYGTKTEEVQPAAMAQELPPVQESTPEPVIPPTQEQAPAAEPQASSEPQAPNYDAFLGEISGGAFKSVDEFKSALPKFGEYDSLAQQKADLEAKLQADPFANDYVKKLNDFVKSGASADQIRNFQRVNDIGDPTKLSSIEAKITKMVMVDGYNESIARQIVQAEFPLEDHDEGSQERVILEEKLRVSSLNDAKELSKFVAEHQTIDTSIQQAQEHTRLQGIAQKAQYDQHVKSVVPQIAQVTTGLGEIPILTKEGEEPFKMKFDYNAEFKATIPEKVESYFMETGTEINQASVAEAQRYIRANYLEENFETIAQNIAKTVEASVWEKAVNKYENRSGLPQSTEPAIVENQQKEYNDFLHQIASGKKR